MKARLLLLLLALWGAADAARAARLSGWDAGSARRLLQQAGSNSSAASAPAAAAAPQLGPSFTLGPSPAPAGEGSPDNATGTIIETLVDQKCSMISRALLAGREIVRAADNPQPDAISCCQSCLGNPGCTAWAYCPSLEGCTAGQAANDSLAAAVRAGIDISADQLAGQLTAPYRGCRLLALPPFRLRKDSPQIVAGGPSVNFISGTPVSITLPVLPNYSVRPGTDTARGLGYSCPESLLLSACFIQGQVEELASICDADPLCKAFVYLPNGVDSLSEPIGILKGGAQLSTLPITALKPNPATALYIKNSVPTTTEAWNDGSSSANEPCGAVDGSSGHAVGAHSSDGHCTCHKAQVLWIALPTLLAAALVVVAAVAVYATLALRQQSRNRGAAAGGGGAAAGGAASTGTPPGSARRDKAARTASAVHVVPGAAVPLPACVTVHLLQASPPGSGHSGGSGHSAAARSTSGTSLGVPCPQCGATLGIAASAPVIRHVAAAAGPPQQQHAQPRGTHVPQSQQPQQAQQLQQQVYSPQQAQQGQQLHAAHSPRHDRDQQLQRHLPQGPAAASQDSSRTSSSALGGTNSSGWLLGSAGSPSAPPTQS